MYSLFHFLVNQHGDEFAPVRCNERTLTRLMHYFEDIVIENKLSALVIEGRCLNGDARHERERLAKLCSPARHVYQFSCDPQCGERTWTPSPATKLSAFEERDSHHLESGPFILVMDNRFCGLLASYALPEETAQQAKTYELMWSFDSNVAYSAIEYLMARIIAAKPDERSRMEGFLNASAPSGISWKLAFSFITKLAMFMQRQNELETAMNRISYAISNTLEIETVLQSAVEEIGRVLHARQTRLTLWQDDPAMLAEPPARIDGEFPSECATLPVEEVVYTFTQNARRQKTGALTPITGSLLEAAKQGTLSVPVSYRNKALGTLTLEDEQPNRLWESEEVLMLKTISDQLAVAISHSRLFRQIQTQAVTDALTGLYNHRYFQEALERELKISDRHRTVVSLILLDLDYLKRINDTHGHRTGDAVLRIVSQVMRENVREIDICARYGGEEFVIVLPQCGREDAIRLAERLRIAIASTPVRKVGQITASIGVATYPTTSRSKEELIEVADQGMYLAKSAGRNCVRATQHLRPQLVNQ